MRVRCGFGQGGDFEVRVGVWGGERFGIVEVVPGISAVREP